ncbi:M48 family metalloprotease [Phaeovulum vinaykumarii]|nr:M48 family metalloprotease [Phaeovulum vinaykumarii]
MIRLLPFLLLLLYGLAAWHFSAWRTRRELDARSTPLRDPRLTPALDRLAAALEVPSIPVHVYETPAVNGLAAPDGRVFLTRGFLDKLDLGQITPDEIASVVAHELGHVGLGHSRRRMIDFTGQNALRLILAGVLGRLLPLGIGAWIAGLLASALAARLSRADEEEADAWASALLVRAGIGTEPQKSLFRKLDRLTGAGGRGGPAWAMSHPATEARIAAIEAREARWRGASPG